MNKNYNYNELVRFYNRSLKKLRSLLALGKNPYKQDILTRRITRLAELLKGMQTQLKLSHATTVLATGFVMFQPNAAKAQSFPTIVANPYGLTAVPTASAAWSTPWFVDLDNDGDKDIMSGSGPGDFYYYQNTGTPSVPSFSAPVMNPFGLSAPYSTYSQSSFVDIDNDGDLDMFAGVQSGDIWYWENNGTASVPSFTLGYTNPNPFGLTIIPDPYGYSAGSFVDIDNDGDMDFVSGSYYGNTYYYENTGTASAAAFIAPVMNPFGITGTGSVYSTATFVDLDGDGDKDLFACDGPYFDYFENTGTASSPAFAPLVQNPFMLTVLTGSLNGASASFADLDADGDLDLISGASNGNLFYFQNAGSTGVAKIEEFAGVSVYPNPTTSNVTLKLNNTSEALSVQVTNVLGQVISTSTISNSTNVIELPEAKGMYFVKVSTLTDDKSKMFKITKN